MELFFKLVVGGAAEFVGQSEDIVRLQPYRLLDNLIQELHLTLRVRRLLHVLLVVRHKSLIEALADEYPDGMVLVLHYLNLDIVVEAHLVVLHVRVNQLAHIVTQTRLLPAKQALVLILLVLSLLSVIHEKVLLLGVDIDTFL